MPSAPACDQCHSQKSRCIEGLAGCCYRCYRLRRPCTYSRRRQRRGRKPRMETPALLLSMSSGENTSLLPSNDSPVGSAFAASSQEVTAGAFGIPTLGIGLEPSLHQGGLFLRITEYTSLQQTCMFFTFGPRLGMEMCQTIRSRVKEAPGLLLNPYGAIVRVFSRCVANQPSCSDDDWSACASALRTLRNAQITKVEHVDSLLSLGLGLVTFHRFISGISASTICRYTLSLIRPFYYAEELRQSDSMELICLIFLDTAQSLFRARVPIIQYQVKDPYLVDQHAGFCGSLLPVLYRVCLLGTAVRSGYPNNMPPLSYFDNVMADLNAWTPYISTDTLERFSDEEMRVLVIHANVHRAMALLILHRLRYRFGERDEEAEDLSKTIVADMTQCLEIAGQYPPNTTLALLVAGAEAHTNVGRQQILSLTQRIQGSNFYPFVTNLRMFLGRVWKGRDQGTTRYLFRLFEEDPDLSVPL